MACSIALYNDRKFLSSGGGCWHAASCGCTGCTSRPTQSGICRCGEGASSGAPSAIHLIGDQTAVDIVALPRDVARSGGSEESDHGRDVFRVVRPAQRNELGASFLHGLHGKPLLL